MIIKNLKHRVKLWLNNLKIAYRFDVLIEKSVTIKYLDTITIGDGSTFQSGVYLYGSRQGNKIRIGSKVIVGMNSVLLGEGGIEIGNDTHFGPNVVLTTQYGSRMEQSEPESDITNLKYQLVRLGKKNWIGAGSVIMPGTILGDNCTVAPNSVVYGQWEDGVVLSGNPARRRKF